jgi:hypothetical protein
METLDGCGITDDCLNWSTCKGQGCWHDFCLSGSDGRYSKIGVPGFFWTSSSRLDHFSDTLWQWVSFNNTNVGNMGGMNTSENTLCVIGPDSSCGNDDVEAYERCDGNSILCTYLSSSYGGGTATCKSDCSGWDLSTCVEVWNDASTGLSWSDNESVLLINVSNYCNEIGPAYYNWRSPTISELRTLVQNCEFTETGGACTINDSCLNWGECWDASCNGCDPYAYNYSKIDDPSPLISSSVDGDYYWYIDFSKGNIGKENYPYFNFEMRCVREFE